MRVTRLLPAVAVVALLVVPVARPEAATQPCDETGWAGATTEWCDGWLVHRDHVYDDAGADRGTQSPHGTGLNRAAGDVDHRQHGQSLNSTDLLVLRLRADGDDLVVRFELNTLLPGDETIAALAIDADGDAGTGGGHWGVVDVASGGWEVVHRFAARDARANVVEGRVPLAAAAGTIRLQAVVALGDGTPMNVAFRPGETGNWWDARQAAALANGDISAFATRVDVADLLAGSTHRQAGLPEPGLHARVYRSAHPLGEGVSAEGVEGPTTASFHYLGTHQPYAVYVPDRAGPHGVQLVLHGSGANHASVVNQDGFQQHLGDGQNRILVSPLGRGPNNSYVDWGARDALDALADVEARYPVDTDARFVSGYSMGGGGTLFFSTMFPDRFAGAIDWVGFTGDCLNGTPAAQGRQRPDAFDSVFTNSAEERGGCPLGTRGNQLDYLDNLRHLPSTHLFAAADELVWANHAYAVADRLAELGYEHRWRLYAAEHLTFAVVDDWRAEAEYTSGRRVVRKPARVTYRTNTFLWNEALELVPDGAYWVDGLRPRDDRSGEPEGDMVVDITSHACPATSEHDVTLRRDAGVDPLLWVGQEGVPTTTPAIEPGNRISGTLTNVSELVIDVDGACLDPGQPLELDVDSDGPAVVRFSDGRPPVSL